jgi:hypothetical protein
MVPKLRNPEVTQSWVLGILSTVCVNRPSQPNVIVWSSSGSEALREEKGELVTRMLNRAIGNLYLILD